MARALRINFPGAWHHITNRGLRKQPTFLDDHDRLEFLVLLDMICRRFGIEIHGYCLMGNHYHLLVRTPEANLSEAMRYLDSVYTQRFNRRHEFDGPLFKGRFYSRLVDTDGYLDRVLRYIHRNPLEAGLVVDLDAYPWSSYPSFLAAAECRPTWLFDGAAAASGAKTSTQLRRLTEGNHPDGDLNVEDYPAVIGSDAFIQAALRQPPTEDQTIGHIRKASIRPDLDAIDRSVSTTISERAAGQDLALTDAQSKLISLGLCQELGGASLAILAQRFGYATAQSAGSAAHRFRSMTTEPSLAMLVECMRKDLEGTVVDERCR